MSALTKVFVILHVVMSMLLTAGLVVFVNRVENFKTTSAADAAKIGRLQDESRMAQAELNTVRSSSQQQVSQAANQVAGFRKDLETANTQMLDLRAQLAELNQQNASKDAALSAANQALLVAQTNTGVMQQQLADLRNTQDKVMQQYTEANLAISDLTNRLEVTERRRQIATEELSAQRDQAENTGVRGGSDAGPAGARTSLNINGQIQARRNIEGVDYATISLGSADAIHPKMELSIVNKNGDFLGYFVVTTVQPNSATGRLQGQRVGEVKAGDKVTTRL